MKTLSTAFSTVLSLHRPTTSRESTAKSVFGTRLTSSARVGCLRVREKGRVGENGGRGRGEKKGPNHRKTDILFVNVHVANVVEGGAVTPRCQLRHSRRCRRRRRLRIAAMF